nr:MAG TPA: hypothetical protein [Caudoviricetes sp.]
MDSKTVAATWLLTHCKKCVKIKKTEENEKTNGKKVRTAEE